MARGAWWAAVHGASKHRTRLSERSTWYSFITASLPQSRRREGESHEQVEHRDLRAVRLPGAALQSRTRGTVRVSELQTVQPRE